ncbi:MAG: hypothetical protein ACKVP7_11095 [Hyphomicrobiaceae bacterium]
MGRAANFSKIVLATAAVAFLAGSAFALEEGKDEKDKLKACEASLCQLVKKKAPASGDFTCALQKTWAKEKIVEGAQASSVSWSFGDARCTINIKLPNADAIAALGAGTQTLLFPEHVVKCEIERDKEITPVTAKLAPKIEFKDGIAQKAWVNLKDVEGPTAIKGLVTTVATVQDGLGLFHKAMIKAINDQIGKKCEKIGG